MKTKNHLSTLLIVVLLPMLSVAQLNFEKDFQKAPDNSNFYNWVEIDGKMYFGANDSHYGQELWQFDPQTEEALRITDINPQAGSAYPRGMMAYGGYIYFVAWTGEADGQHLFRWQAQMTEAENLTLDQGNAFQPRQIHLFSDKIWFTAKTGSSSDLWNYDPSNATLEMITAPADAYPGNFNPQLKFEYEGELYVNGFDVNFKRDLWIYDENSASFEKVPSQFSGQQNIALEGYDVCADELMLNISGDWYHYDSEQDSCIFLAQNNSQTYRGGDCINGKFWYPDYSSNDIKSYDPLSGEVLFLKDLADPAPFNPYSIKVIDEQLYIWDIASGLPKSLYRYDPVEEELDTVFQTEEIIVEMNTLMFHQGNPYCIADREDWEIFTYDTAEDEIQSVVDINSANGNGFNNSPPYRFQVYEDRMFFNAKDSYGDGMLGSDVWTKGSEPGDYVRLRDVLNSTDKPYIWDRMIELNDRLYFTASLKDGYIRQLVSYKVGEDSLRWHGNAAYPPGGFNVFLINMRAYQEKIIFSAFRDFYYTTQFFEFDSNTDEIELLDGLQAYVGEPRYIVDDHLIFTGSDTSQYFVNNLYDFNLETQAIVEIESDSILSSNWQRIYKSGDKVFYIIRDPDTGFSSIHLYDPETSQSTTVLPESYSSINPSYPMFYDGMTWFHYQDADSAKVFTLDPETGICEEAINLGATFSIDGEMIWYKDQLFFYGSEDGSLLGSEIYVYDPLTEETKLHAEINLGPVSAQVGSFYEFDGRLYFIANDGHRGKELWSISDCFEITMTLNSDTGGLGQGSIDLMVEGGEEPYSFSWNTGELTQNLTSLNGAYYEVTVTDATGCQQTAFGLLEGPGLISTTTNPGPMAFSAYPNPTANILHVEYNEEGPVQACLFDQSGKMQWTKDALLGSFDIDVSAFTSGIYFLLIRKESGQMLSKKVMVLGSR